MHQVMEKSTRSVVWWHCNNRTRDKHAIVGEQRTVQILRVRKALDELQLDGEAPLVIWQQRVHLAPASVHRVGV
jgi:hypothetical protein